MIRKRIRAIVLALAIPLVALAHSGGRDIRGTIQHFDKHSIAVKRVDGKSETVPLVASTAYLVGDQTGNWSDLRDGSRVVVHIGHDGKAIEVHLPPQK